MVRNGPGLEDTASELATLLVCPLCHADLGVSASGLRCVGCGEAFDASNSGYFSFFTHDTHVNTNSQHYPEEEVRIQMANGRRQYEHFLKPLLEREAWNVILDAGCGVGSIARHLIADGKQAYGIDLPLAHSTWQAEELARDRFFSCDAARLPFRRGFFDVVYSFGVIEHIGMEDDFATPRKDHWAHRTRFAEELLRVTRVGGSVLVACPNKHFAIDVQHGPVMPPFLAIRERIFRKSRLHLHPIWGDNHLLSHGEMERLFVLAGARKVTPLALNGYFSYTATASGGLKVVAPFIKYYVETLVPVLPRCLNPYVLVRIDK